LGLPLFRKAPWLRWAVPLAAVLLLAILGGVLWRTLSNSGGSTHVPENGNPGHVAANGNPSNESPKDRNVDQKKGEDKKEDKSKQPDKDPLKDKPKDPNKDKPKDPNKGTVTLPSSTDKPNDERKEAGRFVSTGAVLARQGKDGEWVRIPVSDST